MGYMIRIIILQAFYTILCLSKKLAAFFFIFKRIVASHFSGKDVNASHFCG